MYFYDLNKTGVYQTFRRGSTAILDFGKYLNECTSRFKTTCYTTFILLPLVKMMEFELEFIELQLISKKACLGYSVTLR